MSPSELRLLLVGVRSHGGEEVYSRLLAEEPPAGVDVSATLDFHRSCSRGRSWGLAEVLLNRLVHPFLRFDLGFRVLRVSADTDLVHVHSHPTILVGRRSRPVVFSAGSSHFHYVRDYERWTEAKILARYRRARPLYARLGVTDGLLNPAATSLIYTFSHEARAIYLRFGVPEQKVRVLYPGFPVPEALTAWDGRPYDFLFLGRDPRRKGGDLVLEAFARLRQEAPRASLLFVTDEAPASLPEGVTYQPLVPRPEVGRLFGSARVFVNPTRAEGFGFTNAEAQGFGLPVISSRLGAVPEVVSDGETGLLVPPGDLAALGAAMRGLADRSRGRAMGLAARQRFLRHFALPVFQAGLRRLYDEALAGAATP